MSIARIAKARGDDVLFVTGMAFAPTVAQADLRFVPLAPEADLGRQQLDLIARQRDSLPVGAAQFTFDYEHTFVQQMQAQAETLRAIIEDEEPDVVVVDSAYTGIIPICLDADFKRPPIVACGVAFLMLDRPDEAPLGCGLPPAPDEVERERYREKAADIDARLIRPLLARVNVTLSRMGLPALPHSVPHTLVLFCDAYLALTVRDFEYDVGALSTHIKFVGSLPALPCDRPLPDWWHELDTSRKIVLVTQGTVANRDLRQLVEPALMGLADREDILVLATTGRQADDVLPIFVPGNARVETYLPYHLLMREIDLLVTNGGYGTISLAIAAGVPVIVSGISEDKLEVGARVAWSGVGLSLAKSNPTRDEIKSAVDHVLGTPRYRIRARELAEQFARLDTLGEIFSIVDRLAKRRQRN